MDLSTKSKSAEASGPSGGSPSASANPNPNPSPSSPPPRRSKEGDLHVLGQPHETVLYHGDDVVISKPVAVAEEEDDSFFEVEVSLNDVKSMFKDLQRRRDDLENAPLKGHKVRALEKETATLRSLHDHPNTAIRIRFPDRTVIQGIFRTSDTIGSIRTWLRGYLHDPTLEFYLFTAPPKKVLQDDSTLVDEGLVAMVVLYFGSECMPDTNKVLKGDLYSKLSDPEQAFDLAKNKLKVRKREGDGEDGEVKPSTETQVKDHSASTSSSSNPQQPVRRPVDKGKVPKWFKMK